MSARALLVALALAACEHRAQPPSLPAPERRAGHADPAAPFDLAVEATALGADEADVKVRVTPRRDLPSLTVGVDLPRELVASPNEARRTVPVARAGDAVELRVRVRRASPGAAGATLRAWAESRDGVNLVGDERALTVLGDAPPAPAPRERVVRAADGALLHETVVE